MASQPIVIGLCGPNGAGKSTTYTALVAERIIPVLPWVNADELLVQLVTQGEVSLSEFGLRAVSARAFNSAVETHPLKASLVAQGRSLGLLAFGDPPTITTDAEATAYEAALATALIRGCLVAERVSFSFETVMSHPSKIALFSRAAAAGYQTQMIFVCTQDVELNVARVKQREREGLHGVPPDKIRSRYRRCLDLLPQAASHCDFVYLLDTTRDERELVATKTPEGWSVHTELPAWAEPTVDVS